MNFSSYLLPLSSQFLTARNLPIAATNVMAIPGTTTASISFTIPKVVYTPENYSITYFGIKFDTTQAVSMIRMSSSNITDVNKTFVIMLIGLEEDNTYQFTVDSTNSLGTNHTEAMHFKTLSTRKSTLILFAIYLLLFHLLLYPILC